MAGKKHSPQPPLREILRTYEEALRDTSSQLEEKVQELSLLRRIADISGCIYNINLFYKSFVDLLLEETRAMNCSLLVVQEPEHRFYLKAARGRNDDGSLFDCEVSSETSFDMGQGIAGRVAMLKEAILVPDTSVDARFELRYTRSPIGSLLCSPLIYEDRVIGVVNLSHPEKNFFSENSRYLMHIACSIAGQIIGSALIHLQNEYRFREMFEKVPFAIIIIDPLSNKIIDCNQFAEQCFGYNKKELLDLPDITSLIVEEQRSLYQTIAAEKNETSVYEISCIKKGGDICICEVTFGHLTFDNRPVLRLTAIDISSKKLFEKHLIRAEKLRSLGELASGVAHDVNNMLSAVIGRVELAQKCLESLKIGREEPTFDELFKHLSIINQAALDGAAMVRRIQAFSRMGDDTSLHTSVNIESVIKDAIELTRVRWKNLAESRGCTINIKTRIGVLSPVCGNPAELREVFINLINNAVDAMPSGGEITIDAMNVGGNVQVTVSDTGCGIPASIRDRLFDPFFTTKDVGSSGLGLSISYAIINRHHGSIEVSSPEGSGACFCIRLPAATSAPHVQKTPEMPLSGTTKNVLLIDDDPHVSETLSEMLRYSGHTVVSAKSGHEGLQIFSAGNYDVVITDLGMPGMNGYELARRIKEIQPHQPVILITGWNLAPDTDELRKYGIDFIITKPFHLHQLLLVIDQATAGFSSPNG